MEITIQIPDGATLGDITTVQGALADAAVAFVDWERLHARQLEPISAPGVILLSMVEQLKKL